MPRILISTSSFDAAANPDLQDLSQLCIVGYGRMGHRADELALLAAPQAGKLGDAAFDTEPYIGALTSLPNVVLTAQMGSYAKDSRSRVEQEAAVNLIRGLVEQGLMPPSKRGEST